MTSYAASKFLHDIAVDERLRVLARVSPAVALGRYDLSDLERDLFLRGEVGALYRAGVNDFLLHNTQRFGLFGLTMETYSQRMRDAAADEGSEA